MLKNQEIGDYIINKTLGTGTTGKVKLATSKNTGQQVAIKIIKKSQFENRPELLTRITREIAIMRLIDHPHLIKLLEVCESTHHFYIVLEMASHGELFDYLVRNEKLKLENAISFFRELIYGLEYLHIHGICHRDLKPENLLLNENNELKIADFGFARWTSSNIVETCCGSPHYVAPEVIKGQRYDGRLADVWSSGVIFYVLLFGKVPFEGPSLRQLLTQVKQGCFTVPDSTPHYIKDLLHKILCVDPQKRATIEEIKSHPAFRMFLPSEYKLPKPLPFSNHQKPIDISNLDAEFLSIMKSIGFSSEEIESDFSSNERTIGKIFYEMYNRQFSLDSIPWESEDNQDTEVSNDNDFLLSPQNNFYCSPHTIDPFHSSKIRSMSSEESFSQSIAYPARWDCVVPTISQEEEVLTDISLSLIKLFSTIQGILTDNNFIWFHPTDHNIICKKKNSPLFITFLAEYTNFKMINLTIKLIQGDISQFSEIVHIISQSIDYLQEEEEICFDF